MGFWAPELSLLWWLLLQYGFSSCKRLWINWSPDNLKMGLSKVNNYWAFKNCVILKNIPMKAEGLTTILYFYFLGYHGQRIHQPVSNPLKVSVSTSCNASLQEVDWVWPQDHTQHHALILALLSGFSESKIGKELQRSRSPTHSRGEKTLYTI